MQQNRYRFFAASGLRERGTATNRAELGKRPHAAAAEFLCDLVLATAYRSMPRPRRTDADLGPRRECARQTGAFYPGVAQLATRSSVGFQKSGDAQGGIVNVGDRQATVSHRRFESIDHVRCVGDTSEDHDIDSCLH